MAHALLSRRGVSRGTTRATSARVFAASIACFVLALASSARAQSFGLAEPTPVLAARAPITLSADEERRYLDDWRRAARPLTVLGLARVSLGGQAFYDGGRGVGGSFATGVEGGARVLLERGSETGVALVPALGARTTAGDLVSTTFAAGLGLSLEDMSFSMAASARGVAGWLEGAEAIGFEYAAELQAANLLGVEVAHQVLFVDQRARSLHGLRIVVTIDLAPLFHALAGGNYYEDR